MADFFTHFSCVLDVGTPDNAARALDLYQVFMEEAAREDVPPDGFLLSIQPEHGSTALWIRDARSAAGDPLRPALRRGFRSYWPMELSMGELLLAATHQCLRRRRPCARSGDPRNDRLARYQRLAGAHPDNFARQAAWPLSIQCGRMRAAA
jgi:hypothetical protein